MTRTRTAYILALIVEGRIARFGIFSEPCPTHSAPGRWMIVDKWTAPEYGQASDTLVARSCEIRELGHRCASALKKLSRGRTHVEVDWS